jgi:hypothetical protein
MMELLGDVGHVESHICPFGDSANLDATKVHGLRLTYQRLKNHFGHTGWDSKVTWVMWNLVLFCIDTVLVSVQDRCTVYAERTTGLEIILDAHDGTPR